MGCLTSRELDLMEWIRNVIRTLHYRENKRVNGSFFVSGVPKRMERVHWVVYPLNTRT